QRGPPQRRGAARRSTYPTNQLQGTTKHPAGVVLPFGSVGNALRGVPPCRGTPRSVTRQKVLPLIATESFAALLERFPLAAGVGGGQTQNPLPTQFGGRPDL